MWTTLKKIDAAIEAADPMFHKELRPPATNEQLAALERVLGELPEPVADWFRWHDGSSDGFIPESAWGLVTVEEAINEVAFVRKNGPAPLNAPGVIVVPLLTGRDGFFQSLVLEGDIRTVVRLERGELTTDVPFDRWVADLLTMWRAEADKVRVPWMLTLRTPLGWHEVQLPTSCRKRLTKRFADDRWPMAIECSPKKVTIHHGSSSSWEETSDGWSITLSADAATELVRLLGTKQDKFAIPEVVRLKVAFQSRY